MVGLMSRKKLLMEVDYGQKELRVLARESRDPEMIRCFNGRVDIHKQTAAAMMECSIDDVTKDDRQKAKPVNFGIVYGQTEKGLVDYARDSYGVEMTQQDAARYLRAYFRLYKGVKSYQYRLVAQAKRTGYVWINWDGNPVYRREIHDIGSSNRGKEQAAIRIVKNTAIQGGAALYMWKALIEIHRLHCQGRIPGLVGLVGTVHDSLWAEVWEDMAVQAFQAIGFVMVSLPTMGVPSEVDAKIGPSLGEMKEMGCISSLDNPVFPT